MGNRNSAAALIVSALGESSVLTGSAITARYTTDWARTASGVPLAVVLPRSTDEVSRVLRVCNEAGQTVVPQGGMTGLAGAAVPATNDICLSLERLRGIESIDKDAAIMIVRAGTALHEVHEAANAVGLEFALDMASRGSAQVGGAIATNAGGIRVLRSGMMREQVLGLEVVLADGTVLDSMNQMIKNNTGYDLRQWFVGSEGTLGVITRAVLRLRAARPRPSTALCGLKDYAQALRLLAALRADLEAFELMWNDFFQFGAITSPLSHRYPLYALVETSKPDLAERLEPLVEDAAVACSAAEAKALWTIRDSTAEFAARLDPISLDVSIPIARIGEFAAECKNDLEARWPGHYSLFFGHIADSNIHVTLDRRSMPAASSEEIDHVIYSLVERYRGSISAEHGIGTLKRDFLHCSRTPEEIRAMWAIKRALDPRGILNPGKVLPGGGTPDPEPSPGVR